MWRRTTEIIAFRGKNGGRKRSIIVHTITGNTNRHDIESTRNLEGIAPILKTTVPKVTSDK